MIPWPHSCCFPAQFDCRSVWGVAVNPSVFFLVCVLCFLDACDRGPIRAITAQLLWQSKDGFHDGLCCGHGSRSAVRHIFLPQVCHRNGSHGQGTTAAAREKCFLLWARMGGTGLVLMCHRDETLPVDEVGLFWDGQVPPVIVYKWITVTQTFPCHSWWRLFWEALLSCQNAAPRGAGWILSADPHVAMS